MIPPINEKGHENPDDDRFHDECGVFGIFGASDAAALTTLGLHALQHRGQDACGIVSFDGNDFHAERHSGLVGDAFTDPAVVGRLKGSRAIGHNRYPTSGGGGAQNIQPIFAEFAGGGFAVAHNGNITNALTLQKQLQVRGSIFHSTSDTEVITHLIATSRHGPLIDRLVDALRQIEGAYSIVALSEHKLIGVRDPLGIRPLVLGQRDGALVLASETCALDIIGADYMRDIQPGEMVVITKEGLESFRPFRDQPERSCIFEYVYFARPDSVAAGTSVYEARKGIGRELARESGTPGDIVVPVPDSGVPAAIGYAEESGIPFDYGIIRNHYVGRTFIEPTDSIRHVGVKLKHNANRKILEGRRVILIDDSIVRGTTSTKIVQMVRDAGAVEVHMRIASPPTTHSCFYGVDTPERSKLIASKMNVDEIAAHIGVDSLAFLTIDGLYRSLGRSERPGENPGYCDACFTGDYPTELTDASRHLTAKRLEVAAE